MGNMTTITILGDAQGSIENNPQRMMEIVTHALENRSVAQETFAIGGHANAVVSARSHRDDDAGI